MPSATDVFPDDADHVSSPVIKTVQMPSRADVFPDAEDSSSNSPLSSTKSTRSNRESGDASDLFHADGTKAKKGDKRLSGLSAVLRKVSMSSTASDDSSSSSSHIHSVSKPARSSGKFKFGGASNTSSSALVVNTSFTSMPAVKGTSPTELMPSAGPPSPPAISSTAMNTYDGGAFHSFFRRSRSNDPAKAEAPHTVPSLPRRKTATGLPRSLTASDLGSDSMLDVQSIESDTNENDEVFYAEDESIYASSSTLNQQRFFLLRLYGVANLPLIKLSASWSIDEAIRQILIEAQRANSADTPGKSVNPELFAFFRLCKLDAKSPGTRSWMTNNQQLWAYRIIDGDAIRLVDTRKSESVRVTVPPSTESMEFDFGSELLVGGAVARLRTEKKIESKERYGLYFPQHGVWLDDSKTMLSYEIDATAHVELREMSQEFLLRVTIMDTEPNSPSLTKSPICTFTIRVLPTLMVSDVIAMINYTISSRSITFNCQTQNARFGLWLPSTDSWMIESVLLKTYQLSQIHDVQYKLQYECLNIIETSETAPPICHRVYVDQTTTVSDVLDVLALDETNPNETPYALCLFSGEQLKGSEFIWAMLRELGPNDALEYKPAAMQLFLVTSLDVQSKVMIDITVNFARTLGSYIPTICRRCGIYQQNIASIRRKDRQRPLALNQTFYESRLVVGTVLYIEVTGSLLRSKTPESLNADANIWQEIAASEENLVFAQQEDASATAQ